MLWRHTAIYLMAQGLPGLINLGAIGIYSRLLVADEYGRYVFIIASVGLGNKLLFEWLRLCLLRFLPAFKESSEALRATLALAFITVIALLAGRRSGSGPDPGAGAAGTLGRGLRAARRAGAVRHASQSGA